MGIQFYKMKKVQEFPQGLKIYHLPARFCCEIATPNKVKTTAKAKSKPHSVNKSEYELMSFITLCLK